MRKALVTGASGVIGSAIAKSLAQADFMVYVHCHSNLAAAQHVVNDIETQQGQAQIIQFDVSCSQKSAEALSALIENDPIQVVIHNAGIHDDKPLAGMNSNDWHKVIDVSLHGFYNVVQPLLLPMMASRFGRIIAMSSITAQLGNRGQCNYAAAKAGLEGVTRSLAKEVGSRGITVNTIAPGLIESNMADHSFSEQEIKQLIPVGRAGQADEVAALVNFLVSEQASYITGQTIAINGGML